MASGATITMTKASLLGEGQWHQYQQQQLLRTLMTGSTWRRTARPYSAVITAGVDTHRQS